VLVKVFTVFSVQRVNFISDNIEQMENMNKTIRFLLNIVFFTIIK